MMDSKTRHRLIRFELGHIARADWNSHIIAGEGVLAGATGHNLSQWLAHTFNRNFDGYDKAIDASYNATHIGGSAYHHLIDGSHDFIGAFDAVQSVHADHGLASDLFQVSEHLLRDTASVAGINPFFSLSESQFDALAHLVNRFGVTRAYLADAFLTNGPELIGGVMALATSIIIARRGNSQGLSRVAGGCLLSALVSANPALLPVAAGSMAYALRENETKRDLILAAGNGALVSGSALTVSSLVGGPVWIGCILGMGAGLLASRAMMRPETTLSHLEGLVDPSRKVFQKLLDHFV